MWHLICSFADKLYLICSVHDQHHAIDCKRLFAHYFPNAEFIVEEKHIGRIENARYQSSMDFVRDYRASNFLNETIGA
jgi:hypothetical protein